MKLTTISHVPVSVLGLAGNRDLDTACLDVAFAAGINYFFFYELSAIANLTDALRTQLARKREEILVATGSESRDLNKLQTYMGSVCRELDIEIVDVFFLEYIAPDEDLTQVIALLQKLAIWKGEGKIRYLGISTHNRAFASKLIESGQIDVLMHRYNMAHRKAEDEVFPAAVKAKLPVVAFTSTRWGALLKGHPHWQNKIPTAADCYRYTLANEAINVALTSPKTLTELRENLQVLDRSQLTESEIKLWRDYGDLIYGKGQDSFETKWL